MSTLAQWAAGAADRRPIRVTAEARAAAGAIPRLESALVALGALVLYIAVAAFLTLHLHIMIGDAVSRVANAADVFFSRDPHLSAIGFVWNPLPSLLEMPLVAMKSFIPAMVDKAFAANLVSAAFGAVACVYMNRILWRFGLAAPWRLAITGAFAVNPLIVLYGANGMSDLMLAGSLIAGLDGVLGYVRGGTLKDLITGALWLAVGFGVRYEAIPFAIFVGAGALLGLLRRGDAPTRIEGILMLMITPIAYAAGLWIFFNWLIMKDPLYFLNSAYGNASQIATGAYGGPNSPIGLAHHHLGYALGYAAHFTLLFFPVILGLAIVGWLTLRGKDAGAPVVLGALVSVPLLQVALLFMGATAGWDRFFMGYVPMGVIAVVLGVTRVPVKWRTFATASALALFLAGDVGTFFALRTPTLGAGDSGYVNEALAGQTYHGWSDQAAVARYVDAHPRLLVLTDTFESFAVVLLAKNPRQFVITSDRNFESIAQNPRGRVDAILVPNPQALGSLDAVLQYYPGLWAGKAPWATLIRSFPGGDDFRLYHVGPNAPD